MACTLIQHPQGHGAPERRKEGETVELGLRKSLTNVVEAALGVLVGSDERLLHEHLKNLLEA